MVILEAIFLMVIIFWIFSMIKKGFSFLGKILGFIGKSIAKTVNKRTKLYRACIQQNGILVSNYEGKLVFECAKCDMNCSMCIDDIGNIKINSKIKAFEKEKAYSK